MERALRYLFVKIAAFRQFVKDCQGNIETEFPNFPKSLLRDLEEINMDATQIDDLLEEIDKVKANLDEYSKHLEDLQNNFKDIKLRLMEKEKGLRSNSGRSRDPQVPSKFGIQEENESCIVTHPTDSAETERYVYYRE